MHVLEELGPLVNGKPRDSKSRTGGSSPSGPALSFANNMKKPTKIDSRTVYENEYLSVQVDTLQLGKKYGSKLTLLSPTIMG